MNEGRLGGDDDNLTMQPISEGPATQPMTAGALLRNARQQRGLHIAALAVMLKVPQAKLEALEADRHDLLPDATFARALATAVCRALKVDAAPVLALLPRGGAGEFDVPPGLNQPFRERGVSVDRNIVAVLARPVVWGPLLLLLAAAAIYWMPEGWLPAGDAAPADTVAAPVSPSATAFPPAASGAVAEFVAAPAAVAAASVPAATGSAVASGVAPAPAAVTPAATAALTPAPTPATPPAPSVPAGQALRISATAETWVEVVDAAGQVQLSRLMRAGDEQVLGGAAPYKVRIGNVSGTRIEWRGGAVDLSARSTNNVARLELN